MRVCVYIYILYTLTVILILYIHRANEFYTVKNKIHMKQWQVARVGYEVCVHIYAIYTNSHINTLYS